MTKPKPSQFTIQWVVRLILLTGLLLPSIHPSVHAQTSAIRGTIVVGVSEAEPPFSAQASNGRLVGFDIDLIKTLARTAGLRITYEAAPFTQLIPGVATRLYDAAITCIEVTDERAVLVDFSATYFTLGSVMIVSAEENDFFDLVDLTPATRVSVLRGSSSEAILNEQSEAEPILVNSSEQGLALVVAGAADVSISEDIAVAQFMRNHPEARLKIVGGPLTTNQCAIAVSKENPELLRELNAALTRLKNNGKYLTIYRRWFGRRPVTGPRQVSRPTVVPEQGVDTIFDATPTIETQDSILLDTIIGAYLLTLATDPITYQVIDLIPDGTWLESLTTPDESTLRGVQSLTERQTPVRRGSWQAVRVDPIAMSVEISATLYFSATIDGSIANNIESGVDSTTQDYGETNGENDSEVSSEVSSESEAVAPIQLRKEYKLTIQDDGTLRGHYALYGSAVATATLTTTDTVELVGQRIIQ